MSAPQESARPATARGGHKRKLPRGLLTLPPALYVLLLLIGPIVLIAMYSVNLKSQYPGRPQRVFDPQLARRSCLGPTTPFSSRFKSSMIITLVVSVAAVAAAYPVAYFLAFVANKRRYTLLLAGAGAVLHQLSAARHRLAGSS